MLNNSLTTQVLQDSHNSLMWLVLHQPRVFRVPQINSSNSMLTTTISSTMPITMDKRIKPQLNMLLPVNLVWHKRLRKLMATPDLRLRIKATKRLEGGMEIGKSSHAM